MAKTERYVIVCPKTHMLLSIVIPCFNEAKTIKRIVERASQASLLPEWEREILIVDDGSNEETLRALDELEREKENLGSPLSIIRRDKNGGKGAAVKTGLSRARGDYILIQDADSEYDPADYEKLLAPIQEGRADAVFGSRTLGRNNVPYSAIFFYGGLLITKIFNIVFGTRLTDIATCYKIFPRRYIPALITSPHDDFVFDAVDLTHLIVKSGTLVEVGINYRARTAQEGKKLSWRAGVAIVLAIFLVRLGIPSRFHILIFRLSRFIISGGTAAVVNLSVLYLGTEYFGIWYVLSAILSFTLAVCLNFILQRAWVFGNTTRKNLRVQLVRFFTIAIVGTALNTALLYGAVEVLGMWYMLAQVLIMGSLAVVNFFLYRKILSVS